jgi:nucleoside-diphosphate-sugar epimerase
MRIIVIGGTGFISDPIVQQLHGRGHELLLFHRRRSSLFPEIAADRACLPEFRHDFERFKPDIVVDTILSSAAQAQVMIAAFKGIVRRVVVLSSMDAYRACGVLNRTEPGPPDPVPLMEDSPLRTQPAYPLDKLQGLKTLFQWVDDGYDKVAVERVVMNAPEISATILRLPMVYGPNDPLHRLLAILKRIDDRRPAIILDEKAARWRGSRGYVTNVASAAVATIESPEAVGRIYNVAEPVALSEEDWTRKVCDVAGSSVRIVKLPSSRIPPHLRFSGNTEQDWAADTSRIRSELGYHELIPLDAAIRLTLEWERANPPAQIDLRQFDYAVEDAVLSGQDLQ